MPYELHLPKRSWTGAMRRGAKGRCPSCGEGRLFKGYIEVREACDTCRTELHHHRADDAPPYFTIFIAGHLIVGGVLMAEQLAHPPAWLQLAIWLPLTVVVCLALLPRVKGALVGLQWALRMHGFADASDANEAEQRA